MGLDMYLTKRTYVQNWDYMKESEKTHISIEGKDAKHIKSERVQYITEQLMYWRKANQIHNWFVENVQDGEDDCGEYGVSLDYLVKLMNTCKAVLDNNEIAKDLLPTSKGFFFGGQDYDEYYFNQVRDTYKMVKELVEELEEYNTPLNDRSWISYRASW
jgi:hypothetical protein